MKAMLKICPHAHGVGVRVEWVLTIVCELAVFRVLLLWLLGYLYPCT